MAEVVFEARKLTKTYRNGEVEVHALAGVDLELYAGELVVLLGPPGRASRRCSTSWAGSIMPPRAPCAFAAGT